MYIAGGEAKWYSCYGTHLGSSQKVNQSPYDPVIPLLSTYPKD